MINVTLLKQTLARIEANPDEWDQEAFRCDTGMCFAGWAAQLAGGKWYDADPDSYYNDALISEPEDDPSSIRLTFEAPAVQIVYASARAQRVLGLDADAATRLFAASNTLPTLRHIVARLCGEAS